MTLSRVSGGLPLPSVSSFSTLEQYSGSQSKQSQWRCLTIAVEASLLLPTSTVEMSKDHHNLSQHELLFPVNNI